jgi:hypothetical protein
MMLMMALAMIATVATAVACPTGWTEVGSECFRLTTKYSSHRGCAALCSEGVVDGGALPACVTSAEQNAAIGDALLNGLTEDVWHGLYQWPVEAPALGWDRCMSGAAATYANWGGGADEEPDDGRGRYEDCARFIASSSLRNEAYTWKSGNCYDLSTCLCQLGGSPSAEYLAVADEIHRPNRFNPSAIRVATTASLIGFLGAIPVLTIVATFLILVGCCCMRPPCCRRRAASRSARESIGGESENKLEDAERAATALRERVTGIGVALAAFCFFFSFTPIFIQVFFDVDITPVAGAFQWYQMTFPFIFIFGLIGVRPTDTKKVNVVLVVLICFCFFMGAVFITMALRQAFGDGPIVLATFLGAGVIFFLTGLYGIASTDCFRACCLGWPALPTRTKLSRVWLSVRFFFSSLGLLVPFGIIGSVSIRTQSLENYVEGGDQATTAFGVWWFLISLVLTPNNRKRITHWIGSIRNKDFDQQQEAAAIAALVGGAGSVTSAISAAKERFRGLPLSRLSVDDMASNKPSPELFAKTELVALGEVEAFVSHSWQDDGVKKYALLEEWRQPYIEKEIDPTIWLDKACIDQGDIDANLQSLPIFLSGCSSLLCLVGQTYPTRLWCVMEVFTFVKMGGQRDQLLINLVDDSAEMRRALEVFDAGRARTFLEVDRQKLLAVIEASFGTFTGFNRTVRRIIDSKLGSYASIPDEGRPAGKV